MRTRSSLAVSLLLAACGRSLVYEPLPPPETPEIPSELPEQCPPPPPHPPSSPLSPTWQPSSGSTIGKIWERALDALPDDLGLDAEGDVLAYFTPGGGNQAARKARSIVETLDRLSGRILSSAPAPFGALPQFGPNGDEVVLETSADGGFSGPAVLHHRRCGTHGWVDIDVPGGGCLVSGCRTSFSSDGARLLIGEDELVTIVDLTNDEILADLGSPPLQAAAWDGRGGVLLLLAPWGPESFAGSVIGGAAGYSLVLVDLDPTLQFSWSMTVAGVASAWGAFVGENFIQATWDGTVLLHSSITGQGRWGAMEVGLARPPGCTCDAPGDGFLGAASIDGSPTWALDDARDDALFSTVGSEGIIFRLVDRWASPTLEVIRDDGSVLAKAALPRERIGLPPLADRGGVLVLAAGGQTPSESPLLAAYQLLPSAQ